MILKCANCGNTFKIDSVIEDEIVICPICDAAYKVVLKEKVGNLSVSKTSLFQMVEGSLSHTLKDK
jgi:DNA-directed RNA polymerase subunit RPC12/RpoP